MPKLPVISGNQASTMPQVFSAFSCIAIVALLFAPVAADGGAIDDAKAAAAGIKKSQSKRITLYTDLSGEEIDRLPGIFDLEFPKLCKYFRVKEDQRPDWRMTGCLMGDKKRFVDAGLLPDDLPPFEHGFSRADALWLYDQPSDYYRRHLLLHEGVHGFMNTVLGSCGPAWYMEGVAEYIATHRFADGLLTLGYMPRNREDAPQWGRIRIIQDAEAKNKSLQPRQIMDFPEDRRSENEFYAWCWAMATLLDRHPRYQQRFRKLPEFVKQSDFNERFLKLFENDWAELCEEWRVMIANLEYGYDVARSAIDFSPAKTIPKNEGASVQVAADRGWQNSGLRLEAGQKYRLTAAGRYQVAEVADNSQSGQTKIWQSEPNGVSIRYYRGRPLGMLLAVVRPDRRPADGDSAFLHPTEIGLSATLSSTESGTLYLKINDSAGELHDNAGELQVEVRPSATSVVHHN